MENYTKSEKVDFKGNIIRKIIALWQKWQPITKVIIIINICPLNTKSKNTFPKNLPESKEKQMTTVIFGDLNTLNSLIAG